MTLLQKAAASYADAAGPDTPHPAAAGAGASSTGGKKGGGGTAAENAGGKGGGAGKAGGKGGKGVKAGVSKALEEKLCKAVQQLEKLPDVTQVCF